MAPAYSTPKPRLSLTEKLGLYFKLLFLAPPTLAFNLIRCFSIATVRGISYQHYARVASIKFLLRYLTPYQLQTVVPPTVAAYKGWIRRRQAQATQRVTADPSDKTAPFLADRLKVDIEPLSDGISSILWIGDRAKATKCVYFFHGGGYAVPAGLGHFEWCMRAYLLATSELPAGSTDEVAVAFLQYTLVPDGRYPTQLKQAADGLAHLLASGIQPENLVLGGDSAGANLTAQVLSHLLHPHPEARPLKLEAPLAGAFLVSPWVSANTDTPSYDRNQGIDMLGKTTMRNIMKYIVDGRESYTAELKEKKGWCMPMDLDDPVEWYKGLENVVNKVYVTAGEEEVFLDQSVKFAQVVRDGNPKVDLRFEVTKGEAHDWLLMDGDKQMDGDATKRMRGWFKSVFWA
ncbi:Alpha/Beta hydrolase protein [Cladorrhinum samala]|uniref:Alpha/Beta hydrolase protein n=1 Tax=Cladorrhinum samala TaxID=585594 RepID=A0AAV9HVI1_9PEZI|nr:Alpha/Beta hydrolase protein [Cladorrhinum samala]